MTLGSEAARARGSNLDRVDPIRELKAALRHIRAVLRMTTLSSEDIEALIDDEDDISDIKALKLVVPAERNLRAALQQLNHIKPTNPRRGRTGELKVQAVVRAMARAWRVLTGRLPAKDNARFHDLLSSATATVFEELPHQPNWESATETARKPIQRDRVIP
jgi:hypothetical protein